MYWTWNLVRSLVLILHSRATEIPHNLQTSCSYCCVPSILSLSDGRSYRIISSPQSIEIVPVRMSPHPEMLQGRVASSCFIYADASWSAAALEFHFCSPWHLQLWARERSHPPTCIKVTVESTAAFYQAWGFWLLALNSHMFLVYSCQKLQIYTSKGKDPINFWIREFWVMMPRTRTTSPCMLILFPHWANPLGLHHIISHGPENSGHYNTANNSN